MKIRGKLKDIILLPETDYEKSLILKSANIAESDPDTIIVLNCNIIKGLSLYHGHKMEDFERYEHT